MFTDARSRRFVLVAHCVLNQNAISDGTADHPGCDAAVVRALVDAGVGIIQMPCPELNCLGLDRGDPDGSKRPVLEENTRIREALGKAAPARILASLVERVAWELEQYRKHGFQCLGVVGIDRSPSCGVETTSMGGREVPGRGVFMQALGDELKRRGLVAEMIGIKASEPEDASKKINSLPGP